MTNGLSFKKINNWLRDLTDEGKCSKCSGDGVYSKAHHGAYLREECGYVECLRCEHLIPPSQFPKCFMCGFVNREMSVFPEGWKLYEAPDFQQR